MSATDLVHDPEERRHALQPLRFLLGSFRGEGRYINRDGSFHKEVTGSWEAGGRFLGVRMSVVYPLVDGRKDIHEALVLIGPPAQDGLFVAHAYTDGGAIVEYRLTYENGTLSFADRPPNEHGLQAARARKSFTPTVDGFEERLDIDRGDGRFEVYSVVRHCPHKADDLNRAVDKELGAREKKRAEDEHPHVALRESRSSIPSPRLRSTGKPP